jgi:hypothetical protein
MESPINKSEIKCRLPSSYRRIEKDKYESLEAFEKRLNYHKERNRMYEEEYNIDYDLYKNKVTKSNDVTRLIESIDYSQLIFNQSSLSKVESFIVDHCKEKTRNFIELKNILTIIESFYLSEYDYDELELKLNNFKFDTSEDVSLKYKILSLFKSKVHKLKAPEKYSLSEPKRYIIGKESFYVERHIPTCCERLKERVSTCCHAITRNRKIIFLIIFLIVMFSFIGYAISYAISVVDVN